MARIAFIGTGNMSAAIARAAARSGHSLLLYNRTRERAEALAKELGGRAVSMEEAAAEAELLFLGVTPQALDQVLPQLNEALSGRETPLLLCPMAAAQPIRRYQAALKNVHVLRFMPNTPIRIGMGMVLYAPGEEVTAAEEALFCAVLSPCARLLKLREEQIDPVTCVTGCSIAYNYLYIEALAKHAEAFGVPAEEAFHIAAQAVAGAAELALASNRTPEELRDEVCTPGGTSIEGVKYLQQNDLFGLVDGACEASLRRCEELK